MMNNSLVRAGLAQGRIVRLAVCGIAALVCWLNPATLSAASITYVQGNNSDPQASETSVNVTYTAAQAAGDLNVIAVGWNDSTATVSSVTDTKGNVYTRAVGPTAISGLESQSIYYAKNIAAAAAGANSVTVTFSVAAAFPDIRILEYNGADPTNPVDVTAAASGDSATSSSGAVTTTNATDLIFGANIVQTSTTGPGTGFTSRMLTSPDGDIAEDEMVTATGSYSATAALTSGQWIMQMVAFRTPASGTGAPTVTSVSPNSGSTAGGTAVTITGTNFATGATVTFGTAAATNVAVVNSTTITATTPAGSAGAVTVTVTVSGQSGSLASGFTYALAPTVTGVSPNSGSTLGGTAVTVTGTNFLTGATVTFGGTAATNVVVVSSTSITATTPAGSAGAVTVTVTVGGQSGSLASGFTYAVFPTVTGVSPIGGPTAGGTAVTITGTNFATGATVTFGSAAATNVVVVSSTSITATSPAGSAGAVTVTVTVSGHSGSLANGFTYTVAPTVTAVSPNSGSTAGGTAITITGTNFATGATVTVGGTAATSVVVVSGTQITATTPAGSAGAVTVTVTNLGAQSGSLASAFTYVTSGTPTAPTNLTVGAGPGPTYVSGQGYYNTTSLTTHTTASFNSTGGDLILLFASSHAGVTFTPSDSLGNTWIPIAGPTSTVLGFDLRSQVWYAPHPTVGAAQTVTMNLSIAQPLVMSIVVVKGSNGSSPINAISLIGSDNGTSTVNVISPSITTTGTNDLLVGFVKCNGTETFTAGTGFTLQAATTVLNLTGETELEAAAGTYDATFTLSTGVTWQSVVGAVSNNPNQTTLSWTASTEAGGTISQYLVERCQGAACTTFAQIGTSTTTTYNDTGLTASTSYSYRVRAEDTASNLGPYSSVVTLTTPAPIPSLPGNLTATVASNTQVNLAWVASTETGGTVSSYLVQRCQGAGCSNFAQVGTSTTTTYNDTGLTSGDSYSYQVQAKDSAGNLSPFSNVVTSTPGPPTAPSGLTATAASMVQINLSWTASTSSVGLANYIVQRCQGAGCTNFAQVASFAATTTTYSDTGLVAGTSYSYQVQASDIDGGLSPFSNVATATTLSSATAITYVQGAYTTPQSSVTTASVAFTGAQAAGDLNVVVVGWNNSTATVSSVTDTSHNTYTLAVGPTIQSGVATQSIYYAKNIVAAAAGANSVTVTFSAAAAEPDIRILEYTGADPNNPVDVTAASSGSSATSSSGSATTTNATDLIFGANLVQTTTTGPGTGFTSRLLTVPDADIAEDEAVTATGSYSATAPLTSGQWIMQMVAFRTPVGSTAPTVTTVSPNTGSTAGGTAVTITGTNFAAGATVTFGTAAATNVVVVSATQITATTPAGTAGAVTVTVTVSAKSGSLTNGFTYVLPPTVTSVSPNTGSTGGGTAVTITGTNFATGATVTFGAAAATNVVVVSSTSITATAPAGSAGAVTVTVAVSGVSGSLASGFTYAVIPAVTSVSPNTGSTAGGTAVTITGTNFATGATVTFGAAAATSVVVVSATQITATTPAGSAGAVTVTVTVNGQSGSLANGFTYALPPTVTSVSPNSGSTLGGTAVTITGTNFATGATVTFGATAATNVVVVSSTSITATTPAGSAGAVTVKVTVGALSGSLATGFTYAVIPTVTSVSPNTGSTAGGTAVTITGTNFATGATVTFGAAAATSVVVVSATQITATTPAGTAGAVTVTATVNAQSGSLANGFTYALPPTVTSVSPNSGSTLGGTAVTITGTNFATGATVTFGATAATNVVVVSSTSITATTPAGSAGAVTVTVTVGGQSASLASAFTYAAFPTVTSVSPNSGPIAGGTAVTITGTNFATGATVTFGATAATNVVVVSATQITATTPAGTAGAVTVTVTVSGHSGSLASGFTYTPPPTVTSISPTSGLTAGGTAVTITGTNFATGATVTFGATAATNVVVVSATQITATTPAGSAGAVTVTVTVGGQSGSLTNGYTYVTVTMISFVQGNSATPQTSDTSVTVTYTAAQTAGHLNVVVVGWNDSTATVTAVTDHSGNTYTRAVGPTVQSGVATQSIYYAKNIVGAAAGVNIVTVTFSVAAAYPDIRILEYSGADPNTPVDVTAASSGTSATSSSGAVTTTNATDLLFGANLVQTATTGAGTGFTSRLLTVPDADIAEDEMVTAVGSYSATAPLNSGEWIMQMVAFRTPTIPPTVTSVSPSIGTTLGGTAVTITGANFATGATVTFGGTAATNVVIVSATQITATTPAGTAGAVTVAVTVNQQTGSLASGFTYVLIPTVTSVSPNTGATVGGTPVTITGTNFATGATVTFGGAAATNVVVASATQLTATTPAGSAGAVTVAVTVNGQTGSLASAFTYVIIPTVTSVSPAGGPTTGGTAVTLTGTNYATGATVTFGATAATNVVVVSATQITATAPAGTAGPVTVTVTLNGQSGSLANGYVYTLPPTVTAVSPNSGPTGGGTPLTITGTNFATGATVTVGGTAATSVVVVSGTQITATTPAGSAGAATVTVTNLGVPSGSLTSAFTYVVTPTAPTGLTVAEGGPGPIYVNGQGYYNDASLTTHTTAAFDSTGGDLILLFASSHVGLTFTPSDSFGNTWISIAGPTNTVVGSDLRSQVWYAPHPTVGAGETVTLSLSIAQPMVMSVVVVKGSNTSSPIDAISLIGADNGTNSDNIVSPSITTSSANDLLVGFTKTYGVEDFTAGLGFTLQSAATVANLTAETGPAATPGSYDATFTASVHGSWQSVIGAVTNNPNQTTLSWTASTETGGGTIAEYLVERCQGAGCTSFAQIGTSTTTTYNDTGLTASTSYSYRVRAEDTVSVLGPYSSVFTLTTPAQIPSLPGDLTATSPSTTQMNLAWVPSTETGGTVGSYLVQRCQGAGCTNFAQIGTSPTATYSDTNLSATTSYSYRVQASDGTGNLGPFSNIATTITLGPPTAPANLTAAPASMVQISLNWTASATGVGLANYTVQRCQGTGCTTFVTVASFAAATNAVPPIPITTYTDTGLVGGTTYSYQIQASDTNGALSPFSNVATATTLSSATAINYVQGADTVPQSSVATASVAFPFAQAAGDLNVVAVGWSDSTATVTSVVDSKGNTYTLAVGPTIQSGVATQSIYYAKNIVAAAAGANSVTVTFSTAAVYPDIRILEYTGADPNNPVDVTAASTGNSATSSSGAGTTTTANDLIFGANLVQAGTIGPGTGFTSRLLTVPDADIAEDEMVTAVGSYSATANLYAGQWIMQMVAFRLAAGGTVAPPTAPGNLTAAADRQGPMDLAWTASTSSVGIADYIIQRCQGTGCANFAQINTATGTTYIDSAVTSSTTYSYRVQAVDIDGNSSAFSNIATNTTVGSTPPTAPSNLTATAVSTSQINLSWTASTSSLGLANYVVQRCQGVGCANFAQIATPTATTYTDTGLASGTSYSYQVEAVDIEGNFSPFSNVATAATPFPSTTITYVQGAYSTPQTPQTSVSVTYSAAQAAGDLNVVAVGWSNSSATVSSVTDKTGNTYTLAVGPTIQSGTATQAIYYAKNIAPASASANAVTVAFSAAAAFPDIRILEYAGADPNNPVDVTAANSGSSATSSSGSATTTNATDLIFGANLVQTGTTGPGTGFTTRLLTTPNADIAEDEMVTAVGSYSATAPVNSGSWIMQMVAFRTATCAGGPPTVPTNLTASATGVSTISLSWTASTTCVGISHYVVERCQGTSCTSFAQVGTSTGTTFSDTGLTANTSYSYEVQAVDVNSNSSPLSSEATATTLAVSISPRNTDLTFTRTQQFTAAGSTGVTWAVDGVTGGSATSGTITTAGLYTPPSTVGTHTVTVTTSNQLYSASATVYITNYAGTYTYHNDNLRTGQNLSETTLTLSNVNQNQFGKLFSYPIDGMAFASPLYVANVSIPGQGYHNVVYVATENDSVYAFDADGVTTTPLWHVSFLGTGVTTVPCADTGECGDILTQIGITSTPVIDPTSGTIYVAAATKEGASTWVQRLHALDITTGAEKFGGPVVIQASVSGTGSGSSGGTLAFDPLRENQRTGLLLSNGVVYLAWGSHGDNSPWHGWVIGYNATALQTQTMFYCVTPNGNGGGIWQGGDGLATDTTGDIYYVTSNGDFDVNTGGVDYGDTVQKLSPSGTVVDYFTPHDQQNMDVNNLDLGAGGPVMLVDQTTGSYPHLLISAGKSGTIYVINRDNLGKYNASNDSQIVQSLVNALPNGTAENGNFSTPVYYNGYIYFGAVNDVIRAFQLTNGLLSTSPTSTSAAIYGVRGASFAISANTASNGILWALQNNGASADNDVGNPGVLFAYNADNLAVELYDTTQAGTRDTLDNAVKFSIPLVANGKVFVAGQTQLTAFGLLP